LTGRLRTRSCRPADSAHNAAPRPLWRPFFDGAAVAAKALHADRRDLAARELGKDALLEALELRVEAIQRELTRVEREVQRQHAQVDVRILVTGESHIPDLPCALARSSASTTPPRSKWRSES